jgi:demethylmenaquinone methyltransferase/2-methoxy-6-polyprenyl-1,4-benzoquinol methylase
MFDAIAGRYDLLNRLISLGIDQGWRRQTVAALELKGPSHTLDLATGTADLAVLTARTYPEATVTGVDPSIKMMDVGRGKLVKLGLSERIELVLGDAQALPFSDNTFDGTTIAFGIRNVPDRVRALKEMARVTRAGRRIAILELSEPRSGAFAGLKRFHMHRVVPWLGSILSGSREYRYLPESIAAFPSPPEFLALMTNAGIREVQAIPLTLGVCHLYVGTAP